MRRFGRSLQILALLLTPFCIFMPLVAPFRSFPGPELTTLLLLVCLFCIGRLVEGYSS
jgi:hypothetical protein